MSKRMTEKAFLEKLEQGLYKNHRAAFGALNRMALYPKDKARLKEIADWLFEDEKEAKKESTPDWWNERNGVKVFRTTQRGFDIMLKLHEVGVSQVNCMAVLSQLRQLGEKV